MRLLFLIIAFFSATLFCKAQIDQGHKPGNPDSITIKTIDSLLAEADIISSGPEQMLSLSQQALEISKNISYRHGMLHSTYNIARGNFYKSKLQDAFFILDTLLKNIENDSIELVSVINYQGTRSKIYSMMAIIFQEMGDYGRAIPHYYSALKLIETSELKYDVALIYKGLGGLNLKAGNLAKAEEYFDSAIILSSEVSQQQIRFDIYHEQYVFQKNKQKYAKALETSLKLYGLAMSAQTPYMEAIAIKNLGEIYYLLEVDDLSLAYLHQVTDSGYYQQFPNVLAEANTLLAKIASERGEITKSEQFARQALQHALSTSSPQIKAEASHVLAESLEKSGNFRESNYFLKLQLSFKDTIQAMDDAHQILLMQSQHDLDKLMHEKVFIQNQLTIHTLKNRAKNYLLVGSVILILFMLLASYTLVRKYRTQKKMQSIFRQQQAEKREQELMLQKERETLLNMEIEHKNRELVSRAISITRQQEHLLSLINDLENIHQAIQTNGSDKIGLLEDQIRNLRNNHNSGNWEDFKTYFENVYSDFYTNLHQVYPNLTPNENKLCALLKLNLNTKEIAVLTSREVRSIESARIRLRKKLGLSLETNLTTFLSQF
ncbi:MAG: tetratricopeptide repeat protein [Bacteroidales bacterium]|jgi:tetratricopeptide (TPR) repeat protein|nr:tetratricopeptide repeat protein [Bacteroidales bacterium]NCU36729.1 tetratricopeptide repeat protein [Candidatus Falkowbacteria bacterium]MDD2632832.1 tetratricopeptide repeat protein [Bacteroidales bacterium]MDD3130255.1 tetratricopeptide repeat protein [Bacteroidales bacterium]MDD4175632.1 tetratricopeptide repeat protein [Bacteroidales bacterium]